MDRPIDECAIVEPEHHCGARLQGIRVTVSGLPSLPNQRLKVAGPNTCKQCSDNPSNPSWVR
jgi:hypothetical protein